MGPVARALDILQGEKNMFIGFLLPTISIVQRHLTRAKSTMEICQPLVDTLLESLKRRFASQFEDEHMIVAAVYVPKFKLDWMESQEEKNKARELLLKVMNEVAGDNQAKDEQEEEDPDDFFSSALTRRRDTCQEELSRYLADNSCSLKSMLAYKHVREVFSKFNTLLPSSASSERLFSKAKDPVHSCVNTNYL